MKKSNKPDNVVFDEKSQTFNASLKAYATNVGAPVITTVDTVAWKNRNIHKVNKHISAKYNELKAQFDAMMKVYEYNNLIYASKFNFEPLMGDTYHLYRKQDSETFLSMIAPEECNFVFIGSFYLDAELVWRKTPDLNLDNV
jgi:hypothetical protein